MTNFYYKARDRYGVLTSGYLEAKDKREVSAHLARAGLTVVSVSEAETLGIAQQIQKWYLSFVKVKPEEMIVFTRQLASVLDAGIPLLDGLEAVAEQIQDQKLRAVAFKVRENIAAGKTFSDALDNYRKVFSPFIINMVRAGEKAGLLPQVLDRISNLLEKDLETVNKIKSATRYPLIVLVALSIGFVVMTVYVIPQFASFFAAFKTELPLPTRILMRINWIITNFWYWFVGITILGGWSFKKILETEKGRYNWDRFVLSSPVFGPLFLKIYLSRFARMLASMLESGITIIEALNVTSAIVENKVIARVILDLRDEVNKGRSLHEPMRGSQVFPPIAVSMVAIGEKAGTLENMLNKVSDYFDREADYIIKNLTPLLEPLLIVGLGVMILIFALGIFLPMWDLVKIYKTF
ncbi:MAG: type II secretion system F family protein [Candidatus Margulisiibacteriota bacterium]